MGALQRLAVAGLALVACVGAVSSARAQERAGYLVVVGKSTDRAAIADYARALPPIYAAAGGRYLALGATGRGVAWLEGPWGDRSLVLAAFPTRAAVDGFWWGEPYRQAIRKRDRAGVFSVAALEGVGAAPGAPGAAYLVVMTAPGADPERTALSDRAAEVLATGVARSGGALLTGTARGAFTPLEGDTLFDRVILASWPTKAGRDAYLSGADARRAQGLRARAGLSVVVAADALPPPPPGPPR